MGIPHLIKWYFQKSISYGYEFLLILIYISKKLLGASALRLKIPRIRFIKEVREVFGMDRRRDRQMNTSSPLLAHFRSTSGHFQSTSGSLPVHLATMGGHMRHHSYSLPKKMKFPKFADGRTYRRTEKKVTPKDPLCINARDLKKSVI